MSSKKPELTDEEKKARNQKREDIAVEVGEGAIGAIAGATLGSIAGPPGAVVGAILGAGIGAMAGHTGTREDHIKDEKDRELDEEIGVTSGDIGAPGLAHPPTKSQAYAEAVRNSQKPAPPNK